MTTASGVRVNQPLSNVSIMRRQELSSLIVDKIFKPITVNQPTGFYYRFDGGAYQRLEDDSLDDRGRASEMATNVTQEAPYNIVDYGKKEFLSDRVVREAHPSVKEALKRSKVIGLTDFVATKKEERGARILMNAATYGVSGSAALLTADQFDNPTSKPYTVLGDFLQTLRRRSGHSDNIYMITGATVTNKLYNHPEVLARLSKLQLIAPNNENFKQTLSFNNINIKDVLVGAATKNTGAEGLADNYGDIWSDKSVLLAYINPNATTILEQTLCKSFEEAGRNFVVTTFKESPEDEGMYYKVSCSYDLKMVDISCGFLITNAIA